jgi:hypothetical protein
MTPIPGDTNAPSYGSLVSLDPQGATPPIETYVTANSLLFVQVWNSLAAQTVFVTLRLLLPDGTVKLNKWQLSPTNDRSPNSLFCQLTEGFILSLMVQSSSLNATNKTYAVVFLGEGSAVHAQFGQVLSQGYIGGKNVLTWPPGIQQPPDDGTGAIFSITGTVPGAGAEISEVVPTHARWKVLGFRFTLTTAVAVANRQVDLILDDGANTFAEVTPVGVQAASLVQIYNYMPNVNAQAVANGIVDVPFPNDVLLSGGFRIRTHTLNLQAADQYTAPQYLVQEWLVD